MAKAAGRRGGLRGYTVIWSGQLFGVLGSGVTRFAVPLWVWEQTQSATAVAYLSLFSVAPLIFISPFTGALVDRWNARLRRVMMLSDLGTLLSAGALLALLLSGELRLGWIYALLAVQAFFESFQWPAYSTASTVMVPKADYARAAGMQSTVTSVSGLAAPVLGALLYGAAGLKPTLLLNLVTALIALAALLLVTVPVPDPSSAGKRARGNLWREAAYGFQFIAAQPSLLALQTVFLLGNLCTNAFFSLQAPMILARTGGDQAALAAVRTAAGVSSLLAGIILTAWGGPRKKIHGVLGGWALAMTAPIAMGLGQSVPAWMLATIFGALAGPLVNASNQAIWQTKTPPGEQGKVFAARRVIAWAASPLATLIAGPLADRVLGPAMLAGGTLAPVFGGVVGTGPGAGISLLFLFVGALGFLVVLMGYSVRRVREVEHLVPDFDQRPASGEPSADPR